MNLKKLLATFAFITVVNYSCIAQIKWNANAGLTYSNVVAKDRDGNAANTSSVPGIYLGLGIDLPFSQLFAVRPAIVYAKRGFKQPGSSHIGWGKDFEAKTSYIELPVDFLYSPTIGPGNLLLAVGPYVGYGTGGRWTTSQTVVVGDIAFDGQGDIAFQNDAIISGKGTNSHTYANPWDYGLHFRIGYALFGQYSVSLDVQRGIADLQPRWGDFKPESTVRNKSLGITAGYSF